jgi:lincosamide nucleotidyltransferase A/C/D/E
MGSYSMPAETALELLTVLGHNGVRACVGGGWSVDALLGAQTRPHADLDLWIPAADAEALFTALVAEGVDRVHPWPGDRPWNFVLHDGRTRRVDLHFYEHLDASRLSFGSITEPFYFTAQDLSGAGAIAGEPVRCESPEFALRCHTGYEPRTVDRQDVAALCRQFRLPVPAEYETT